MNEPLVTVIMSVYSGEKYLREAIDSILRQTYINYEFIIVDDGSSDNSVNIIKSFTDTRIKLIKNKHNIGLSLSLNKAIKLSNGRYIARMDADDIALPDRLERQVNYLQSNSHVDILGGQVTFIGINGIRIKDGNKPLKSRQVNISAEFSCPIIHPTYMVNKEVYDKLNGYREMFTYGQDYDLILRAIDQNFVIENMPDVLLYYRTYPGSQSIKKRRKQLFLTRYAIKLHHERLSEKGKESACTLSKIKNFTLKDSYSFSFSWALRNKLLRGSKKKDNSLGVVSFILVVVISILHYEVFFASLRGYRYSKSLKS